MSYVAHKTRLFRDAGDLPDVVRKRSEGRMKIYPSTTDARAWGVDGEDRRQHILDLVKAEHEKVALGKYVPIEVLIDTLLANKNADIARLREQVEELQMLLDMYSQLDLTEDQKRKLNIMKQQMGKAGGELDDLASARSSAKTKSPRSDTETTETEETEDETTTDDARKKKTDTRSTCSALSRTTTCSARSKAKKARAAPVTFGPAAYDSMNAEQLKEVLKERDAQLAAKQAECDQQNKIARTAIEQLENLKDIMEERDHLKRQLEDSLHELETLRKRVQDPCVAEIAALEKEIERLRTSGQLSPDEEAEVIRKEVDVLKKYCAKLSSIQEENNKLKAQLERLQELSGIPKNVEDDSDLPNDPAELKKRLKDLRRKFAKLTEIMDDRDKFKQRVQQLEAELSKYGDLPEEIETFRKRSQMLDNVMDERNNLQKRLDKLKGMEGELKALKKKADRVDELERLLGVANEEATNVRRNSAFEIQNLKAQREASAAELETAKLEREQLRMKTTDMAAVEEEVERLRYRAKEAEVLRMERDRLKVRIDELSAVEVEYMQLLDKTRGFENIRAEREMYKQKYEELLGLECECDMLRAQVERFTELDREREALLRQIRDCECCIADQEDEIKRLVTHIDRLSQGSNQQQDRMQRALCDMRAELDQKNCLIASSEEQLAGVQDQLKSTIAGVSCETTCLRARIEELEGEGNILKDQINEKDRIIHSLSEELRNVLISRETLQNELHEYTSRGQGSFDGDEHLQGMLRQSKCAVTKVAEELGKQYEEWDCMKGKVPQDDPDLFAKYSEEKRNSLKLSKDVDELQTKIRELEEQLRKAEATIAKLREQVSGTENLSLENQALRRHSTEVQDVAKEQIEELVQHLKKAKERIAELEAAAGGEASSVASIASKADNELKNRINDLEAERDKLNKLVAQLQEDAKDGGADVGSLRMQIANLEEQLQRETQLRQTAEERVTKLNKELDNMADTVQQNVRKSSITETELEAELRKIKAENQQLKENIKSIGDSAARRTSLAEDEVGVIAEQNKQLLKEKLALESENASLKQQLESLMKSSGDAAEIANLVQERDALLAQIEEQKREIKEMVSKLSVPTSAVSTTAADLTLEQLEKERKEKADLQNMIKNLQDQINSMEGGAPVSSTVSDGSAVNEAIAKLTRQLEQEQAKAAAAEATLKKLQSGDDSAVIEDLQERIRVLEAQNEALRNEIYELEQENKALESLSLGDQSGLLKELGSLKNKVKSMESGNVGGVSGVSITSASGGRAGVSGMSLAEIEGLKLEIEMWKDKVKDLENENAQLATAAAGDDSALLNQLNELKHKINGLEVENMELKNQLLRVQSELSGVRRMSKEMEAGHAEELKSVSLAFEERLKRSSQSVKLLEEAMNLSAEDQIALDKMKQAYEDHIKSLEQELANQKKQCADTIQSLKSQYDRDFKNINNKYNDGIAKLQGSHEEILKDVSKEYEREVDNLRTELRKSKETISTLESGKRQTASRGSGREKGSALSVKTIENVDIKPTTKSQAYTKMGEEKDNVCTCGPDLENILNKILKDGFESLSFDELQFLHTKTCEATTVLLTKHPGAAAQSLKSATPIPIPIEPPREVDKLSLMRRISGLEGDLMKKQKHAQEKVGALQIAVKMERERLEELKRTLEVEKQRNNELMCKIGAQSRAVANMQVERDMMRKQSSFHEEKLNQLMCKCEEERARVKHLEDDLHKARQKQKRDSEALESMRIKLEKSLNNEMVLKMQLDQRMQGHPSKAVIPCVCRRSADEDPEEVRQTHHSRTSSFYTELTVQDIRKKRNFVHHCCMKHRDHPAAGTGEKRSSSVLRSSPKTSDVDD
ncbi:hypothetical protein ILUMI_26797 [Ignelater luminosus]|uniref:Uncharacterized protein n=1 Tax=Ignelater luminosus TaxID=2038154 RepID=A0A8K0FX84_IGNLU|nr:hypothetical protein ILUMI_26797 [Ignelater luminosus]